MPWSTAFHLSVHGLPNMSQGSAVSVRGCWSGDSGTWIAVHAVGRPKKQPHYTFCEDLTIMQAYENLQMEFSDWLEEADMDPCISNYFISTLHCRDFPPPHLLLHDNLRQADEDQHSIGWDNILFGRIALSWMCLQDQYLCQKRSKWAAERWAVDLLYQLLKMSHGLWTARNGILHKRDQQGLPSTQGRPLPHGGDQGVFHHGAGCLITDRLLSSWTSLHRTSLFGWAPSAWPWT
jgi:hypothetical protein